MEEILKSSLNQDEEILWRGKAEPFETLDKTNKQSFVKKALIGAAIVALFLVFMLLTMGAATKMLVLFVIILLLCAIPSINVFSDANKLKKIEYIATSERLLVVQDSVRGAYYSDIRVGGFHEDADGHISLLCGPDALKAKPSKWREICVVGNGAGDGDEIERFCFYAPTNRDALKKLLHERMPSVF